MRDHRAHLDPSRNDSPDIASLKVIISNNERTRSQTPTLTIGDGTIDYAVYDYLQIIGGVFSTIGTNGLKITLNPYYAACRLSSDQTPITAEAKVSPFATNLSGFTVSSDVLTVTNAGIYRLDMSISFITATAAGVTAVGYRINGGTTILPFQHTAALNTQTTSFTSVLVNLAAGDTVEFRVSQTGGGGSVTLKASTEFSLVQVSS